MPVSGVHCAEYSGPGGPSMEAYDQDMAQIPLQGLVVLMRTKTAEFADEGARNCVVVPLLGFWRFDDRAELNAWLALMRSDPREAARRFSAKKKR